MNLANKITFVRLALIPIYILLVLLTNNHLSMLIVFSVASFTDFLDGYIARKYNMVTDLGKLLDPLVDKILTLSAFILMSSMGVIHPVITIIVVSRELIVSVFRALAASKQVVIAADIFGKVKTVLQILSIIVYHLFHITGIENMLFFHILIGMMTILTLFSGFKYILDNKKVFD